MKKTHTGCSLKIVFFPLNFVIFLNSASSAAALVFYLPGVCTHTDTEGKQRKARVRNILKSSEKTQYLMNTLYLPNYQSIYLYLYIYLSIYMVFIKYCVFFRRFWNIPDSGLYLFFLGVSVCTHTRQLENQCWSRTGRGQKNHKTLRKKHNI